MKNADNIAKQLQKASIAYYNTGTTIMSDDEFDALKEELTKLNPNHPFLKKVGAPLAISVWPKRKHESFMGSQEKITTKAELQNWKKRTTCKLVSISHKLDGCTLVLTYKNGVLKHATSRGDGLEGEDLLPNALKMQNVKAKLPISFTGDLRGEIVLPLPAFEKYFKPLGYKNARNSANGKARDMKDVDDLIKHLKVICFDVRTKTPIRTETLKEKLVRKMGLEYVQSDYMDIDRVWAFFEKFDRDALPFLIDGLVLKLDNITEQNKLGIVSGKPRGQLAIKFPSKTATTIVMDITWQVGRSGRITPVAELKPVELDGVTIKRSTLNNLDYIKAKDVAIGDTVVIARQGDIIPAVIRVIDRSKRGPIPNINKPKNCPSCGNRLERDGAYVVCAFAECSGAVFGDLITWIKTHNMLGFGQRIVSELIDNGVDTPAKLYRASHQQLEIACGSSKTALKLAAVIDKAKAVTLDKFLAGLNIPHLGKTNSKRITKRFSTLDKVLDATEDDIGSIQGIKTTAATICDGIKSRTKTIVSLLKHVKIKTISGPLKGLSITMTGLRGHKGHDLATVISDYGGDLKSGVSKEVDLLIIKDPNSTSNKAMKAKKYGVKLISPDELFEMVGIDD
jgi:DNA ligase (NAD+)